MAKTRGQMGLAFAALVRKPYRNLTHVDGPLTRPEPAVDLEGRACPSTEMVMNRSSPSGIATWIWIGMESG